MSEKIANEPVAIAHLASGVSPSTTTWNTDIAAPTVLQGGSFRVIMGVGANIEICRVTAGASGTSWTVERGLEGTAAREWPAATAIFHELTAASILALLAESQSAAEAASAQGTVPTAVKTAAYTAEPGQEVRVDISGGSVPVQLPTKPADRTRIGLKVVKISGTVGSTSASLVAGGTDVFNIVGGSTTLTFTALFQGVTVQYVAADGTWVVQSTDTPLGSALGAVKLGADATVGGPGGSALTGAIVTASTTGGIAPWTPHTHYAVNALVQQSSIVYICKEAHESGEAFSGAGAHWEVLAGPATIFTCVAPTGTEAATDTAILEAALNSATATNTPALVRIEAPGTYLINKELIEGPKVSIILGPATTLKAAPGFTGTVLSSAKAELSVAKSVIGGGTIDSNNSAAHAFWPRYFKHAVFGIQCKNSVEDDVIIGDITAPGPSIEPHLTDQFWINRDAGTVPVGHYALWIQNCSDGRAAHGVEVKGQETGVRCDSGGWKWFGAHPYGAAFPMQVCADDNAGVEWVSPNFDTPTAKEHAGATGEAAATVITDAEILAQHAGRPVYGTNIPAESFVGAVIPATSFILVNTKGEAVKPTGAVAGVTLAGVGIMCRASGYRVIGGQTFVSGTYGADNTAVGAAITSNAPAGVILGFRGNGSNNEHRLRKLIEGNTTKCNWSALLQPNVVATVPGQNPSTAALLALTQFAPSEQHKYSTESKVPVRVDKEGEENLQVTFTAPESGHVLVRLSAMATQSTASDHVVWRVVDNAEKKQGPGVCVLFTNSASFKEAPIKVTGLTPGETYTFHWAWEVNAGKGEMIVQNEPEGAAANAAPATMEVWAA